MGVIDKRHPHRGGGLYLWHLIKLCYLLTYVKSGHGVLKLHWTSTSCTNIPTFLTIYSCLTLLFKEMTDVCPTNEVQMPSFWLSYHPSSLKTHVATLM